MDRIIDNPDLMITAAYGQFLPTKLLNAAKIAAINVHGPATEVPWGPQSSTRSQW